MALGRIKTSKLADIRIDLAILLALGSGQNSNGQTYHVDGNAGSDGNDGFTWANAKKTLAPTMALSHANIASGANGWAARNRIFIKGDSFDEDLTKLAQKTDIIGVGSCDHLPAARIQGNHAIDQVTGYIGCRFINVMFRCKTSGGDIMTILPGTSGHAFINCYFDGTYTTPATGAILSRGSTYLQIINCIFDGAFSDAVIELGTGAANQVIIEGNKINGANQGIDVKSGFTCGNSPGYILNNVFKTALECINDASDKFVIANNVAITLQAKGTAGAGAIVGNEKLSAGNKISASDLANADWPALGAL